MGRNSEFCIRAGEFARLCNTTRDTLRYYHKQGILVPWQDEENGYHYYSYAQVASFYFIMIFRQLDCSVADIQKYLLGGEESHFDTFVDKQYAELLKQRQELEKKISLISGTRALLREIRRADTGEVSLRIMPKGMKLKVTKVLSSPATSSGEIMEDIRRHLTQEGEVAIHRFPMGASMDAEEFLKGNYTYKQVFSFVRAEMEAAGEDIISLSGRRAAVCVCRDSDGDIKGTYEA